MRSNVGKKIWISHAVQQENTYQAGNFNDRKSAVEVSEVTHQWLEEENAEASRIAEETLY